MRPRHIAFVLVAQLVPTIWCTYGRVHYLRREKRAALPKRDIFCTSGSGEVRLSARQEFILTGEDVSVRTPCLIVRVRNGNGNVGGRYVLEMRCGLSLAIALSALTPSNAADLSLPFLPSPPGEATPLYDPTRFEIRGGYLIAPFGAEGGTSNFRLPRFPEILSSDQLGGLAYSKIPPCGADNLSGGTSYVYADGLWTANFNKVFAEVFFGGLIHNGPLEDHDPRGDALGCRELYHMGADLGYRFDQHWSIMATFEHGSNGAPTLSRCSQNRGLNVTGMALGFTF
jgi:lipid A 3-O-deacylase